MTGPADTAETDQLQAAIRHARRELADLADPLNGTMAHVERPDWVVELATRVNAATTVRACTHILTAGPQPINVLAWAPDARLCSACARDGSVRAALLPGATLADRVRADETCDACHEHRPGRVALSVLQTDSAPFLVWCGLCPPCRQDMADQRLPA